MQKVLSWRELLKDIISNLAERERIATEIGVNPVTLLRWASGETKPRPQNLRQLVTALPQQYCDQFLALLGQDGLLLEPPQEDDSPPELPLSLVNEVLGTRANSPDILRYWAITRQVLQHALRQLDPGSVGMAITLVHCMPPTPDGKIHSLRESVGLGSAP